MEYSQPIPGVHTETGLYHMDEMPPAEDERLKAIRDKQLRGEPLTIGESLRAGRDSTVGRLGDYELRADHVYRAVGKDALDAYVLAGMVVGAGGLEVEDEYEDGNNKGVDWYLGGVALRYGMIVLEAPADPNYFQPASQNGHALAVDPRVRHMKSSGSRNPVPMTNVRVISTS